MDPRAAPPRSLLDDGWRDRLRALPVFESALPGLDLDALPSDPLELVAAWLNSAIEAGIPQPHAAALATADAEGRPSVRTLIVKDLDDEGLWFASQSGSPKGRDLAVNPRASLLFYWKELGRQLRVSGVVERGSAERSAADLQQRHPSARLEAIVARQSEPREPGEAEEALAAARAIVERDPDAVAPGWAAYLLRPDAIEFWAASPSREHLRVGYRREGSAWHSERLWA